MRPRTIISTLVLLGTFGGTGCYHHAHRDYGHRDQREWRRDERRWERRDDRRDRQDERRRRWWYWDRNRDR